MNTFPRTVLATIQNEGTKDEFLEVHGSELDACFEDGTTSQVATYVLKEIRTLKLSVQDVTTTSKPKKGNQNANR